MKIEEYISHFVTLALLALSVGFRNPWFAGASVVSLALVLFREIALARIVKSTPEKSDEIRRTVQDMNARIATLEYGVKTRGF